MARSPLVAIVGSGPSGLYAAEALAKSGARVDVFERLPAPFGLVRYGVAPDHEKIKSIVNSLARVFDDEAVRFFGNVQIGHDVSLIDLSMHYDAVIHASGASVDRRMGIGGEDLLGSFSATEFVSWYSGHPDSRVDRFALTARSAVVVGAGNVALDVARILLKRPEDLARTDMPDHVLETLTNSQVQDVHILARRGPAHAKFTTKELREIGQIADVDVLVRPRDLELNDVDAALVTAAPILRRNIEVLSEWSLRPLCCASRRLHLHFWTRPEEILGGDAVAAVRLRRTEMANLELRDTDEIDVIPAQLVLRAVGYRGTRTEGLPFDSDRGIIPNHHGRVLGADGVQLPGQYVTGWIKRGPQGVIGTNRGDATQTVDAVIADLAKDFGRAWHERPSIDDFLLARGLQVVDWSGWRNIDRAEVALGASQRRTRVKISDRAAMLRHAAAAVIHFPTAQGRPDPRATALTATTGRSDESSRS